MKVRIRYFAVVRELAGRVQETVEVAESTNLLDLLRLLANKYGEQMEKYILDLSSNTPRPILRYVVNGMTISTSADFAKILGEGSVVSILPTQGG